MRELRIDKNGKAVNRLVRPTGDVCTQESPFPVPAVAADIVSSVRRLSASELIKEIKEAFVEKSSFIPHNATTSMVTVLGTPNRVRHLEKLHHISRTFDYRDADYFRMFLGQSLDDSRKINRIITAIESFEFCAAVEDAAPNATGRESRCMHAVLTRAVDNVPDSKISDVHAGDVSAQYLMERVGFDVDTCFGSKADYYRAMEQVRLNLDVIKPYLPVIIMVAAQKRLKTADELFSLIDDLSVYPAEEVPLILNIVKDRNGFDRNVIDEVLKLGVGAVSSGVL